MIASEYAKAIFELAQENDLLDSIRDQFETLLTACDKNKEIYTLMDYPNIGKKEHKAIMKKIMVGFDEVFVNFVNVLIDNGRFSLLGDIYHEFVSLVLAISNILSIDVYTPYDLNAEQLKIIENKMKTMYKCKKVIINTYIDTELIGGIKIVFNGQSLDLSLQDKLLKLRSAL